VALCQRRHVHFHSVGDGAETCANLPQVRDRLQVGDAVRIHSEPLKVPACRAGVGIAFCDVATLTYSVIYTIGLSVLFCIPPIAELQAIRRATL